MSCLSCTKVDVPLHAQRAWPGKLVMIMMLCPALCVCRFIRKPTGCNVSLSISYEVPEPLAPFANVREDSYKRAQHAAVCVVPDSATVLFCLPLSFFPFSAHLVSRKHTCSAVQCGTPHPRWTGFLYPFHVPVEGAPASGSAVQCTAVQCAAGASAAGCGSCDVCCAAVQ